MPKHVARLTTCLPLGPQMANTRYVCLAGAEQCIYFWRNWRVGDGGEGGMVRMFHTLQNSESLGKRTSAAPIRRALSIVAGLGQARTIVGEFAFFAWQMADRITPSMSGLSEEEFSSEHPHWAPGTTGQSKLE